MQKIIKHSPGWISCYCLATACWFYHAESNCAPCPPPLSGFKPNVFAGGISLNTTLGGEGNIRTERLTSNSLRSRHLTFQNPCYINRLEVYMVNSPSWPNVRPVAPPPPGACVRHTFALPPRGVGTARPHVSHSVHVPRITVIGCFPLFDLKSSPPCVNRAPHSGNRNPIFPALKAPSRQKTQPSCLIKAYQGSHENFATNRQPAATAIPPGNSPLCGFAPLR